MPLPTERRNTKAVSLNWLALDRIDPERQSLQCHACGTSLLFSENADPTALLLFIDQHDHLASLETAASAG